MLAVVGSRLDPAARALVAAWSSEGAVLLAAEDLSRPGWHFRCRDPAGGTAVVDGQRVPVSDLAGVLTRRPSVVAEELTWITPADRPYLAAEMNAFLVTWLSALPCPVVNRPTPSSLLGPAWGPLHWAAAAGRAGVTWTTEPTGPTRDVVVCGRHFAGVTTPAEASAARALAVVAGVDLLGVRFAAHGACAATTSPSLDDDEARAAVLRRLLVDQR